MSELKFTPWETFVEPEFWTQLTQLKLHQWRLDDSAKPIHASYRPSNYLFDFQRIDAFELQLRSSMIAKEPMDLDLGEREGGSCRVSLGWGSLEDKGGTSGVSLSGSLHLYNTLPEFIALQRDVALSEAAAEISTVIESGDWLDHPEKLNRMLFTCFADLKKYVYVFWPAFPAFPVPDAIRLQSCGLAASQLSLDRRRWNELVATVRTSSFAQSPVFIARIPKGERGWELKCLSELGEEAGEDKVLVFVDPASGPHPGWPLRNLLCALATRMTTRNRPVRVLGLRYASKDGLVSAEDSLLLSFTWGDRVAFNPDAAVVGWERGQGGKLGPRKVDMSSSMDPVKLSAEAVWLNLSLMRWRVMPELDVGALGRLRCLLFGAGTLGSNVARGLLGWGVSRLTFVDSGRVSYSNPARQSLYVHEDCLEGGKSKAAAAAEAIRRIVPSAQVEGHEFVVPMPGHPVDPNREAEVKADFDKLVELVKAHDVIFLLLDSREARWLPTLLATAYNKVCLTMALGFDSFLVIRHGYGVYEDSLPTASVRLSEAIPGNQLACYFCADVTAPGNSTLDRTLDQQCTVSRPGLSLACAGAGVELLAAAVQHPDWPAVPAANPTSDPDDALSSHLGLVPHQIRSYFSRWSQLTPAVQRFQHCVACSPPIQTAFAQDPWPFVRSALSGPEVLEATAGLADLQAATEQMDIRELSDDESLSSVA